MPAVFDTPLAAASSRLNPGAIVWFTGLPSAGKTTLARAVSRALHECRLPAQVIDGDELRAGVSADLGFSSADRAAQARRAAEAAVAVAQVGGIALVAVIAPALQARAAARELAGRHRFLEIYLSTPVAICRQRDPKGLYALADVGLLRGFTGVDASYEPPARPDLVLDTSQMELPLCVAHVLGLI